MKPTSVSASKRALACLVLPVLVEERQHESLELGALLPVGVDPVAALDRETGGVDRVERLEERFDTLAVLVDERRPADHAVADEGRVLGDALERRHVDGDRNGRSPAARRSRAREGLATPGRRGKRNTHSSSTIVTS